MSSTKLIVILGATGTQGGSVLDTFLAHPEWRVRGITRSAASSKSQALIGRGAEMVEANVDDVASLQQAFAGASVVFSTTDFWGNFFLPANQAKAKAENKGMPEWMYGYELQQGKNIIDAAAATAGLERFIFSGLSDASKWSHGKYRHVYHFDAKAHAITYGQQTHPQLWAKASVIQVGWYVENFLNSPMMMPRKNADGVFTLTTGVPTDVKLPFIATAQDTGPLVLALVKSSAGKNLIAYREWASLTEWVQAWSEVVGVPGQAAYHAIDLSTADEMLQEVAEGFAYWAEFGYEGRDDNSVIHPHELDPSLQLGTMKDWVAAQDWSAVLQA